MKIITSVNNPYIKEVLKLHQRKYREETKTFLIEGYHLVKEASAANLLQTVFIVDEKDAIDGIENIKCSEEIIAKLSQTNNPQNILGIASFIQNKHQDYHHVLLLDDISDPGNLGTIIRSALGFNIDSIIMSANCVDLYNDKVIRASQGAIFHVNIVKDDLKNAINTLKNKQIMIIGTSLYKAIPLKELDKINEYAIVLGNEAHGVNSKLLDLCDVNVKIEIDNKLESLNVAIAGSIIMYYLNN